MSIEEKNKAHIRRMYQIFNRRQLDRYPEIYTPGYIEHYPDRDVSLDQVIKEGNQFVVAFPDLVSTIEDMVAEGDKVAIRVTHRGTHQGKFMGIAPTGNKIEVTNTAIFRITGGKCADCWATIDSLRMMQQLGVIPKQ
jgi:predicted ester cyclase